VQVAYDFTTNPALREMYTNVWGALDKGRLFEDMDALAGNVSFRHAVLGNGPVRPPMLVTAAVDEVRLRGKLAPESDVGLQGRVAFVGSSSMLVRCEAGHIDRRQQPSQGSGRAVWANADGPLLVADFLYVSRDRITNKASRVNRLRCDTEEDQKLFDDKLAEVEAAKQSKRMHAEKRLELDEKIRREARRLVGETQGLLRMPSLQQARSVGVLVKDTELQNTMICQPQQRNTSGRVFGGFLMRRGYELAVATAYCFSGSTPRFLWSDEISFQAPVSVGDVLRLDAHVILSEPERDRQRVHCDVLASVLNPHTAGSQVSNRFSFSFSLDEGAPQVSVVRPSRTSEAIRQMEVIHNSQRVPDWDA